MQFHFSHQMSSSHVLYILNQNATNQNEAKKTKRFCLINDIEIDIRITIHFRILAKLWL